MAEEIQDATENTEGTTDSAEVNSASVVQESAAQGESTSASNGAHGVSAHDAGARSARKVREGLVVSDKMDKTVVVAVERLKRHPLYGRVQRVTKKFQAHDENNECKSGDRVRIMETRPMSRHKRWRILEVVERAK